MNSLCILLPLTTRGSSARKVVQAVRRLGTGLGSRQHWALDSTGALDSTNCQPALSVCIGLDAGDELEQHAEELAAALPPAVAMHVLRFNMAEQAQARGAAPICWMWSELAAWAESAFQPEWTLLLGDDVRVEPLGWPALLAGHAERHPRLRCIALLDAADPGFPSFAAVHASHLRLFGRLLPDVFVNQGGDPYLFELYRSIGAADVCAAITVHNNMGGMEGSAFAGPGGGSSSAPPPRYTRVPLPPVQLADLLESARARLLAASPGTQRRLQVAVAVPTYRVDITSLGRILDAAECSDPSADVRVLIQVDHSQPSPDALAWLCAQQASRLHHMRVRLAAANGGAAAARNHLLDEALGCDLIVFFDDDVLPSPGCLDAYVAACRRWPQEAGFAGPTVLPRAPTRLLPTAIHMSDVSFFWEAPATLGWSHVPWAVTANMAVRQTSARFRDGFPKTGGGEDVDFCLLLGGRLRAVPEAAAVHPWWPEHRPLIYRRFWRWATGDGRLIELWPALSYRRAPNAVEMCCALLALGALRVISARCCCAAALGVLAADFLLDLLRNCMLPQRQRQHPCVPWLRPAAAADAWLIKSASEAGRLWAHMRRGSWRCLLSTFDWFGGMSPAIVSEEQRRMAGRAALCTVAALLCTALT